MPGLSEVDMGARRLANISSLLTVGLILASCSGVSTPAPPAGSTAPTAPTISVQPTNQSVVAGQTATFSVTAAGTAPLSYQWQKGNTAITGATSASYTTAATTTADSGSQFSVIVNNAAGNVTSKAATLAGPATSVAPSITQQPPSVPVTGSQTATFSVTATGTDPLSY